MCIVERVGCEDDATIAWTADSAENYCILRRRVVCFTPEASERNFLSLHAERGHRSEKSQRRVVFATSYSVTCLMWTGVATRFCVYDCAVHSSNRDNRIACCRRTGSNVLPCIASGIVMRAGVKKCRTFDGPF
jgi:hypothetical protein